ncbi:MAG TPA: NUDIX hydrolase [Acidimicrobiales bacterium]|nr:NUDIX hydrolase [Acidimicrobiales bacterium]
MRWTVHGERSLYSSEWVGLSLVDVEIPDGERFEHHVVRSPSPAAGMVIADPGRGVLLMWRHRFITDSWGWEIPAGKVDDGETPIHAAVREAEEETGWRPHRAEPLIVFHPMNGLSDQSFHVFVAPGAEHIGEPTDASESERIEWVPLERVRQLVLDGEVLDGMSVVGLLALLVGMESA